MNLDRRVLIAGAAAALVIPARAAERRRMVITGHMGNIGSRLLPHYRESWDVAGIDKKEGPEFDLSSPNDAWLARIAGADTIIHLAAIGMAATAEETSRNDIPATSQLVEAAIRARVRRVVFGSSTWACPAKTDNPVGSYAPVNLYGVSKLFGEALVENAARDRLLTAAIIRIGWAPPAGTDTSAAAPWLQKLLWRDAELRHAFDQGVSAAADLTRVG